MYKLNQFFVSGAEVYSVPQAPVATPSRRAPSARPSARTHALSLLNDLLRHSSAVGSVPPMPRGHGR